MTTVKSILLTGITLFSLSAFAGPGEIGSAVASHDIHFSAQEIAMLMRSQDYMNVGSMCFLLGRMRDPQETLAIGISNSDIDYKALEEIRELARSIEYNSNQLVRICTKDKATVGTVYDPMPVDFSTKKPKQSEMPKLMREIESKAEQIVTLQLRALQKK